MIRQHILTFWLRTTNGVKPNEETFVRKSGAQNHKAESQENPPKRERSRVKHWDKGLS